jgi:hypothetical protein
MASSLELLSGVLRFFPNTMIVTLIAAGLALGRISWVLVGAGGIILSAAILTLQSLFSKGLGIPAMPGVAVLDACSLIPTARGADYFTSPSLWMALTTFFAGYIFTNALNIYTMNPAKKVSNQSTPVQQRKGLGIISMLAIALLFAFMVFARARSPCETGIGSTVGVLLGAGFAYGWWFILEACGSDVFPDVHGVLASLNRGTMHNVPRACVPRDAAGGL